MRTISFVVTAGRMTKAKVDFGIYGITRGNIDSTFKFGVRVYDNYLNTAWTNPTILKNIVMI
jgi:hypothetical protein